MLSYKYTCRYVTVQIRSRLTEQHKIVTINNDCQYNTIQHFLLQMVNTSYLLAPTKNEQKKKQLKCLNKSWKSAFHLQESEIMNNNTDSFDQCEEV